MAHGAILANAIAAFLPNVPTLAVNVFDKIGFDIDHIGRKRQTRFMQEQATLAYRAKGIPINIAIWNMHVDEDHKFEDIFESGLVPMGKGGGFRIVVFGGQGWLENKGSGGSDNWLCSGNFRQKDNKCHFEKIDDIGILGICVGYVSMVLDFFL